MKCNIHFCIRSTEGSSIYCRYHKKHKYRHGNALQRPIQQKDLKDHLKTVQKRIKANPENPLWSILNQRWEAIIHEAKANLNIFNNGTPFIKHTKLAYEELIKLNNNVPYERIAHTALAMVVFQEKEPHAFVNDKCFLFQLAKRVRGLCRDGRKGVYNPITGETKYYKPDGKPAATEFLGKLIDSVFGVAGMKIAELEAKEQREKALQKELYAMGLRDLRY